MKATTSHEEGDKTLKDTMKCTKKHHLMKMLLLNMACNIFSFLLGAFTLSAPFVFYTLIGSVLNAVIHFIFSLPLATMYLVYAYSGFEESIYLYRAYKNECFY